MADNDQHTSDNSASGFDSDALHESEYLLERIDYDLNDVLEKSDAASSAARTPANTADPFAEIVDQWEAHAKYVPIFIDEAELSVDQFADFLLTAEGSDTHATAKGLLVIAHRLKGSAASLGLNRVAKLAHLMEDLLQDYVDNNRPLTQPVIDALLLGNDGFQRFIASLKGGQPDYQPFAELAGILEQARTAPCETGGPAPLTGVASPPDAFVLSDTATSFVAMPSSDTKELFATAQLAETARSSDTSAASDMPAASDANVPANVPQPCGGVVTPGEARPTQTAATVKPLSSPDETASGVAGPADDAASARLEALRERVAGIVKPDEQDVALYGEAVFQKNFPLVGLKARLIYEKLSNFGTIRYFAPSPDELEERDDIESVSFGLVTERSLAEILPVLRVAGVAQLNIYPLLRSTDRSALAAAKGEPPPSTSDANAAAMAWPASPSETEEEHIGAQSSEMEASAESERPAAAAQPGVAVKPLETVRVDITRLDQLMNLAGQLVIHKARITQTAEQLKKTVADKGSAAALRRVAATLQRIGSGSACGVETSPAEELEMLRGMARRMLNDLDPVRLDVDAMAESNACVKDLADSVHLLDRVSDGIQQEAMNTRMAPIGPLFGRFKRVIRDLTHAGHKNVRLVIQGEHTELDKRMIDELGDPLISLVRNAVEHGIETPEDRQRLGKPAQGTITLDAFRRGNSIVIQISDDGRGLDADRILAKALERKLVAPAEAAAMSRHDIFQLIWESGLSTTDRTTQGSGRGTGMDVVKSKIADLSGTVDLNSEPGRGTTLIIRLPLTLAILPSLMVNVDGDVFAVPLESVAEIVSVSRDHIMTVHGQPTARVRDRTISMISIGAIFTWNRSGCKRGADGSSETTLVILDEKGQQLGLVVDHVLGEEDIVIKSIAENYRTIPGVTGASIRGDGRVSLILDPPAMFTMLSRGKASLLTVQENPV